MRVLSIELLHFYMRELEAVRFCFNLAANFNKILRVARYLSNSQPRLDRAETRQKEHAELQPMAW